ncbi:hypothetical protein [Croceimicrobium sp.]|uniref:hypothetical protein n=1 Tax=Croceimicrobium sp. TaxID=2828340 RepID=UPI003BA8DD11
MKQITILLCSLLAFGLSGQYLDLELVNSKGDAVEGVIAIDYLGQEYGPSNARGTLRIPETAGSAVQLFKEGYYIKLLQLDWTELASRKVRVELQSNAMELAEVEVRARVIAFTDTLRVQDFDFQNEMLLVLGYDYLVLAQPDLKALWSLANHADYTSLERDPRGNLFLLSEDSASQVILRSDQLYFYPAVSRSQYGQYIEPLVAQMGNALVLRNNQMESMPLPVSEFRPGTQGKSMSFPPFHNQGVQLFIYREGKEAEEFFFSVDTPAVIAAHQAFMNAYSIAAGIEKVYDMYGVWQHEKLFDLDIAQKMYRKAHAQYFPTPMFQVKDEFWLFDRYNDQLVVFNAEGHQQKAIPFSMGEEYIAPLVIQDYQQKHLYALRERRGMVYLYPFDGKQLERGQKVSLFARETKVYDGMLYYIDEYNFLHLRENLSQGIDLAVGLF